ncbi:hypothetical protein [Spirosoma oryzicola]|uniref:hypothetical protein n=1 Tax=Spirosoma oryzicola TaxID=2898794 RepID=UPI001E3FBD15|nr:hypothetical protein [Spirosoma oryzicola]UHG92968.1 hypothetical protein LQ777_08710 [Spirosoma oryzicola]
MHWLALGTYSRNRSHCQFLVAGYTKLPDNEHIKLNPQVNGNFVGYGNAPTR